jgi:hypothetical protein
MSAAALRRSKYETNETMLPFQAVLKPESPHGTPEVNPL